MTLTLYLNHLANFGQQISQLWENSCHSADTTKFLEHANVKLELSQFSEEEFSHRIQ